MKKGWSKVKRMIKIFNKKWMRFKKWEFVIDK